MNNKIKARVFPRLNQVVMAFGPYQESTTHPMIHFGLNPELLEFRHDIFSLGALSLQSRRENLKKRLIDDYLEEDRDLREVDLAYINTQPH